MGKGDFNCLYAKMDELMFEHQVSYLLDDMAEELEKKGYPEIANKTKQIKETIQSHLKKAETLLKNQTYFQYIYQEYEDWEWFGENTMYHLNELEEEYKNDPQAFKKIQSLNQFLQAAAKEVEEKRIPLEGVWKAVEFYDTTNKGIIEKAIKDYQKNKK